MKDLARLYSIAQEEQRQLQRFYEVLGDYKGLFDEELHTLEAQLEEFLDFVGLPKSQETLLAAIQRIVNLREDMLLQVIAHEDEEERIAIKERAYVWVSRFYIERFERILLRIEKEQLLTPFYRRLLRHAHNIGKAFSDWHSSWMAQIIYGINKELYAMFEGDEEKIFYLLQSKNLFDRGHGDEIADRSYTVLRLRDDGEFERLSYAEAFKEEVERVTEAIDTAIEDLAGCQDEQKDTWIAYLQALRDALAHEDPDELIGKWADVDRAWMRITTPLQLGHPLEYYEDRYRKAVALEWDVRLSDPDYPVGRRAQRVKLAFEKLYGQIGIANESVYASTLRNLEQVQLYVGRPLFFYGSEFNGLFSAQVVPNDEVVSKEMGKKIFAYPDMILQTQRAKPRMRLGIEIYGEEVYDRMRSLLDDEEVWRKIYDATTIGHEYGHILWMDERSESVMNGSGMFKLAEEFKATCGGLMSYFLFEDGEYYQELLLDHIQRSVSLVGWMEVEEVLPYYVEGLLHLQGLFETGVLDFDGRRLDLHIDTESFAKLQAWYESIYKELARIYLLQRDVKEFLERYIYKKAKSFLPNDERVAGFVEYYYDLYQKIGRELA